MLEIEGQLCYSPQPPHRYGRGPLGHGPFCQGDIQVWNIIWLSCPAVDRYLEPKANAWEIAKVIPSYVLADATAALRGQNCVRLFPNLREALRMPPIQFIQEVQVMRYQLMPMYLSDPQWITTIQARALQAQGNLQQSSWDATKKLLDGILKGGNTHKPKPND